MIKYEVDEGLIAQNMEHYNNEEIEDEFCFKPAGISSSFIDDLNEDSIDSPEINKSPDSELDLLHKLIIKNWFPDGLWEGYNMEKVREELYSLSPSKVSFSEWFTPHGILDSTSCSTQEKWTKFAEAVLRDGTDRFRYDYDGGQRVFKRVRKRVRQISGEENSSSKRDRA